MLLAELTNRAEYNEAIQNFCNYNVYDQKRTPKGLLYIEKSGTLCHASNIVFLCLQVFILAIGLFINCFRFTTCRVIRCSCVQAANIGIKSSEYRHFAKEQIHYILGDGGQSFMVGFGNNYPRQPHHAARYQYTVVLKLIYILIFFASH